MPEYPSRVASRVEIIERRRLVVGDREIDLAALVPEGGGPATQELDASPGGSKVDEAVVLSDRVVIMTSSPGSVKDIFDIDLPRPRGDVQSIRHEERFLELQGQIWESLRAEVTTAYAQTVGAA